MRNIHPFAARMASELLDDHLSRLSPGSTVLDPMCGSGTVLKKAVELGHNAIGFDMDPLAVLMTKVALTAIDRNKALSLLRSILRNIDSNAKSTELPKWIEKCNETTAFVKFWFGLKQRRRLSQIAVGLSKISKKYSDEADVLRLALSKIIVCKKGGASLAWDVSHGRPHKVYSTSDYDVLSGFQQTAVSLIEYLGESRPGGKARVRLGDARLLTGQRFKADTIFTSPPYLNAIDYMRGHKFSLVWLGYTIPQLRNVRSASIGAERSGKSADNMLWKGIVESYPDLGKLNSRQLGFLARYVQDLSEFSRQMKRRVKIGGELVVVMGDSCLTGVNIKNSDFMRLAAESSGFALTSTSTRAIEKKHRYLPITANGALAKRMTIETVHKFRSVAPFN